MVFAKLAAVLALLLAPLVLAASAATPPRYSVVLIAADGLRADRLGLYGCERPTSPRLDARAKDAVVFERAYASATWTLPSFGSLFTGLAPRAHGAISPSKVLPAKAPLLAEAFRRAGARTAGWIGGYFLDPVFGFGRGFELYRFGGWGDWQFLTTTSGQASRWIARRGREPFFAFVHGNDMHPPFSLPEADEVASPGFEAGRAGGIVDSGLVDYVFVAAYNAGKDAHRFISVQPSDEYMAQVEAVRSTPGELERLRAHYDGRVARVEEAVERVFAGLDAAGRREDTIVVLLSDHGLELGERGTLGTALHVGTPESVIRVPLLVWHPALKGRRVAEPVSLQDLGATLLELTGLPASLPGRSFAALIRGEKEPAGPRDVFALSTMVERTGMPRQTALVSGRWKLVEDEGEQGTRHRLYDLEKDPGERDDLWTREPARARQLSARLAAAQASDLAARP